VLKPIAQKLPSLLRNRLKPLIGVLTGLAMIQAIRHSVKLSRKTPRIRSFSAYGAYSNGLRAIAKRNILAAVRLD
jgi:hypothetical protein